MAAARDTLGGAVAASQQLPTQIGTELMTAAREAFTTGLHVSAAISAVIAVGIAVVATILLRAVRPTSEEPAVELPATPPEPAVAVEAAVAAEAATAGPAPAVAQAPAAVSPEDRPMPVVRTGGGCFACPPSERSNPAA